MTDVLLRPFRADELDAVMAGRKAGGTVGRISRARLARRLAASGRLVRGRLDLAIEADGRLVGGIDARQPRGALPPGVFEIGYAIFDETDRGRGIGTEAIRQLVSLLFASFGAERVQASTAVDNVASRRALERVGFVEEGVMRAFMPSGGGRVDYVLYAVTRGGRR